MFNKSSIFFTLTISFIVSVVITIGSFIFVADNSKLQNEKNLKEKYFPIAKMIHKSCRMHGFDDQLQTILNNMNMKIIKDQDLMKNIMNNKDISIIFKKDEHRRGIRLLSDGQYHYIYVKTPFEEFFVKDTYKIENNQMYITIIFIAILLTLTMSYITIVKKFYPLKKLKENIKNLGDEDFNTQYLKFNANDEVSQLAHEFSKSAVKLKAIKEARNIFIRNMMHELKTPIAKGKFLVELEHTQENNNKMRNVFYRLESLINQFASVEEMITLSKTIKLKEYHFDDVLAETLDMLLIDEKSVEQLIQRNDLIKINFKLFSIALKNLIDNGLKYSLDGLVKIIYDKNGITIENKSLPLNQDIENYYEPFIKDDQKSNGSFGLGLYIVHSILHIHGLKLEYKHKDGLNMFTIKI